MKYLPGGVMPTDPSAEREAKAKAALARSPKEVRFSSIFTPPCKLEAQIGGNSSYHPDREM